MATSTPSPLLTEFLFMSRDMGFPCNWFKKFLSLQLEKQTFQFLGRQRQTFMGSWPNSCQTGRGHDKEQATS